MATLLIEQDADAGMGQMQALIDAAKKHAPLAKTLSGDAKKNFRKFVRVYLTAATAFWKYYYGIAHPDEPFALPAEMRGHTLEDLKGWHQSAQHILVKPKVAPVQPTPIPPAPVPPPQPVTPPPPKPKPVQPVPQPAVRQVTPQPTPQPVQPVAPPPVQPAPEDKDHEDLFEELMKPEYFHSCFGKPGGVGSYHMEWTYYKSKGDISKHPDLAIGGPAGLSRKKELDETNAARKKREDLYSKYEKLRDRRESRHLIKRIFSNKPTEEEEETYIQFTEARDNVPKVWTIVPRYLPFVKWAKEKEYDARVIGIQIGSSFVFTLWYIDHTHDSRITGVYYRLAIPASKLPRIKLRIDKDPSILIKTYRKQYPGFDNSKGKLRIVETIYLEDGQYQEREPYFG